MKLDLRKQLVAGTTRAGMTEIPATAAVAIALVVVDEERPRLFGFRLQASPAGLLPIADLHVLAVSFQGKTHPLEPIAIGKFVGVVHGLGRADHPHPGIGPVDPETPHRDGLQPLAMILNSQAQ